jgi:hypothetical protein
LKVEDVANARVKHAELGGELDCALEDEGVMSIAIKAMATTETLIHNKRKSERRRRKPCYVERGIFMGPDGVMKPAHHMSARRCERKRVIHGNTRLTDAILKYTHPLG